MLDLYEEIRWADSVQIVELVDAVINRYSALFPDWEISVISLEKSSDRNEQIDRVIALLEQIKTL